jgi:hypothetical protein
MSKFPLSFLIFTFSASQVWCIDTSNELRMILQQDRYANIRHTESAIILKLGAESEVASYLKAGGAVYGALPLRSTPGELLGPHGHANGVIGEAWVKAEDNGISAQIGRMRLDWPLLNSNDVSLMPNLFEALDMHAHYGDHWDITVGHARKMAGWENGGDPFSFSPISDALSASMPGFFASPYATDNTSVSVAGVMYSSENQNAQLWGANVNEIMNQLYFETGYTFDAASIGFQALRQEMVGALKEYRDSGSAIGINNTILGVEGSWNEPESGVTFTAAYNRAWAKSHDQSQGSPDLCYGSGDVLFTSGYYESAHSRHGAHGYKIGAQWGDETFHNFGIKTAHTDLVEHGIHFHETSLTLGKEIESVVLEGRMIYLTNGSEADSLQFRLFTSYLF